MKEVWKDINGYEGYYQVSNLGNVRSLDRHIIGADNKNYYFEGKSTELELNHGYYYVRLKKDGIRAWKRVNRLVAEAFIPNPDNKPEVDHINTNKLDNRASNLRWATHKENMFNDNTRRNMLLSHK